MEETLAPIQDRLDPARAAMLWTVLGAHRPAPEHGAKVPTLFHHVYFWRAAKTSDTRVVVAGKLRLHAALRFGISAELKTGLGSQCTVLQRGALALSEELALADLSEKETPPVRMQRPEVRRACTFSADALWTYAALTMSPNRVHFDGAAAQAAGWSATIVDARLMAQHLAIIAEDTLGAIAAFDYRAFGPVLQDQSVWLCAHGRDLWIELDDGRVVMTARAG